MEESRLRVGGWVRGLNDEPAGTPAGGYTAAAVTLRRGDAADSFSDGTESWYPDDGEALGVYRGRRRNPGRVQVTWLRAGAAAAVVVLLLVGTSALARLMTSQPVSLPAPPSTPEATEIVPTPTGGTPLPGRLGPAPTPSPTPVPAPPPPATTRAPATTPPTPTPAPPSPTAGGRVAVSYEAEDATLEAGTGVVSMGEASGGEVVRLIWWGVVIFQEVSVVAEGEYELVLHYASEDDRAAQVQVNDAPTITVELPGLGEQAVGSVSLPVELVGGDNRVHISAASWRPWLSLDRITLAG